MSSPVTPLAWPDPLLIARAWLLANLDGTGVVTATDGTFGTDTPSSGMSCPLVLLEPVVSGGVNEDDYSETALVDVSCFSYGHDVRTNWTAARALSRQAHALMVRLAGVVTPFGTVDEVRVVSAPGQLPYSNPNLTRFLGSYDLTVRAL